MRLTRSNPSIPGNTISVSTRSTDRSPSNCKAPSADARTSISKSPPSGFKSAASRAWSINSTSVALSSTIRIVNGALDLVLVDRMSDTPPCVVISPSSQNLSPDDINHAGKSRLLHPDIRGPLMLLKTRDRESYRAARPLAAGDTHLTGIQFPDSLDDGQADPAAGCLRD